MLRDYPKMEGENVKDNAKQAIRNLLHANSCVHRRRLIAEFPEDGIKCMERKTRKDKKKRRKHRKYDSSVPSSSDDSDDSDSSEDSHYRRRRSKNKNNNQSSSVYITIGMQKVSNGLF